MAWGNFSGAPALREPPAGRLGSAALLSKDLHAGPPRATAAPTDPASAWDGPGAGQCTGFARAAPETAVLVPAVTIPPFL